MALIFDHLSLPSGLIFDYLHGVDPDPPPPPDVLPEFIGQNLDDVYGRQYVAIDTISMAGVFAANGLTGLGYSLVGIVPPGVAIDPVTGDIDGTSRSPGTFGPAAVRFGDGALVYADTNLIYFYISARQHTYRDLVTRALERAGRSAAGNAPSGEEIEDAIDILRDMLEAWRDESIDLGLIDEEILLDSPVMADRGAFRGLVSCLAVDIAIDAGLALSVDLHRMASDARGLLIGRMIRGKYAPIDAALRPRARRYNVDDG